MCFHGYLAGYLLGVTRSLCVDFYFLNFFNAEDRGKRPLYPFQTITPERQRQNADIPESKASFFSFVKGKDDVQEFWS